jgi:hypothetical protein
MVTLTTPYGSFSAEEEREALRLARKAKREAEKQEQAQREAARQAEIHAQVTGYRVYSHLNGSNPRWEVLIPNSKPYAPKMDVVEGQARIRLETPSGSAEYRVPRWYLSLVAVAWDAAGFHVALFLKNPDGKVYAYSIGVHEGVVCLADLPGITMDQFAPA